MDALTLLRRDHDTKETAREEMFGPARSGPR